MIRLFFNIFWRDVCSGFGRGGNLVVQMGFVLMAASMFSFAVGAKQALLQEISVGVVWVSMLLGSLLSLPHLFEEDYEDGSLQLLWMQGLIPEGLVSAKIVAHICVNTVPFVILVPILAQMLYVPDVLIYNMLAVIPVFASLLGLIGAVGAALTLGLRRAGALLAVLVLPLYVPVLIFAVSAVTAVDVATQTDAFLLLVAMVAVMLPVGVIFSTMSLQQSIQEA